MSEQDSDILARLRAANPALVDEDRGRGAVAQAALQRILGDPAALAAAEPDERAARRPRSRPRQTWRRPRGAARATVAAVPVLVTIIVTVVVAAIALTSLRHHHSSVRHQHGSTAVAPTVPRIAAKNGEIALDLAGQLASGHVPAVEDRLELVNPEGSGRRYAAAYPCPRSAAFCDVWAFAWSPGGTQLAYLAGVNTVTGPNEYTLYVVGANGQQPRPLTACVTCSDVSWSPDGSQIAVERYNGRGGRNVWVVNATTGAMRPVIDCPSGACGDDPQWSPSGRSILFVGFTKELGPESGYVDSLDTIDPRRLATHEDHDNPRRRSTSAVVA